MSNTETVPTDVKIPSPSVLTKAAKLHPSAIEKAQQVINDMVTCGTPYESYARAHQLELLDSRLALLDALLNLDLIKCPPPKVNPWNLTDHEATGY